jgi:alpha-galactosidase
LFLHFSFSSAASHRCVADCLVSSCSLAALHCLLLQPKKESMLRMQILLCNLLALGILGLDNGLGVTPPRGWRSWDAFENSINQTKQQSQVDALVSRSRNVDGKLTSLADLGYNRIGLDDAWQDCGKGVNGSFHDVNGKPLINSRFPDMRAMNQYAKSKGIGSGWYLNSCDCCERGKLLPDWDVQMNGDVKAVKDLLFDGLKLDSCGPSQHLAEWARLLNASGWPVLVENCFDNASFPFVPSGADDGDEKVIEEACPMNMFRTGGDMRAQWPLMLRRLQTIVPWQRLSRPGCWAYLDMLEVGSSIRISVFVLLGLQSR